MQRKPTFDTPGDVFEQEADRIAALVKRLGNPGIDTCSSKCATSAAPCPKCSDSQTHSTGSVSSQPLRPHDRTFFEGLLGAELGQVRVHADSRAAEAARAVKAKAYTMGFDIVFGTGQYSPETVSGRALLGHELAHVAQQGRAVASIPRVQRATDQPDLMAGIQVGRAEDSLFWTWVMTCLSRASPGSYAWNFLFRLQRRALEPDPKTKERLFNELVMSMVPGVFTNAVCNCFPPPIIVGLAEYGLSDYPDALEHLLHYLGGSGAPYVEDVERIVLEDPGFKRRLEWGIADAGVATGELRSDGADFSNKNWRYAFGAVDLIKYEILQDSESRAANATFGNGTALVKITIDDAYEWHPDEHRAIPCLHTGMELMKAKGAQDFKQVGSAAVRLVVPRELIPLPDR
jgi:hypothetical protein